MITVNTKKQIFQFTRGLAIAAVAASSLALFAQESDTQKSDKASPSARAGAGAMDKESIIKHSAQMNMAVMKVAELAQQKAENQELKQFAQTLKQDHQQAQQKLEQIAQTSNVTLPTQVDEKCKQKLSELQALSGEEFDKEFAKCAVEGHAMGVTHTQQASTSVQDPQLRQYLQQSLAKMKEHQEKGRQIAQAVGVDRTTIASIESKARQEAAGGPASAAEGTSRQSETEKSNKDSDTDK